MVIENMMDLISDYGISFTISAVFLYIIFKLVNIGFRYIEIKLERTKHDGNLQLRQQVDLKIQYLINTFISQHDGHCIQIIEFSNSVMSVAYLPFRYMTCTYEVCTPDRVGTSKHIDRLSTSLFTQFFSHIQDKPYCEYSISNHDVLVGGAMYDLMKDIDETQCLCTMLKTAKGTNIGYIAYYKDDEYTDEDRSDIQALRNSVQSLLCVAENKDVELLKLN